MTVIMFQPRFAPMVADGSKQQTVRPPRKRPIKVGDKVSLRKWAARPYGSPQIVLRESVCAGTAPIMIAQDGIVLDGVAILGQDLDRFAVADGFRDWNDLLAWFSDTHALPLHGILIRWAP